VRTECQRSHRAVQLPSVVRPSDIAEQLEVRQPEAHLGSMQLTISRSRIPAFTRRLASKFREDGNARNWLLTVGDLNFDGTQRQTTGG